MDAFEAYKQYCALKSHFYTKHYDYFKYGGRVRAGRGTFDRRADKYFFHKLSKQKNVQDYLVANFVYCGDQWVGDLVNNTESDKRYRELLRVRESMSYIFETDLRKLDPDFNSNFTVTDGQHPIALKKYLRNEIHIETLIILDDLAGFFKKWNKQIHENVLWPSVHLKCKKYRPFLQYDRCKLRKVAVDLFQERS
jgi:hypothetical protein